MAKSGVRDVVREAQEKAIPNPKERAKRAAAELAEREAAFAALPPEQRRVLESKARLAAQGYRASRPVYDGQPHPERALKAADGIDAIPLLAPVPGAPTPTRSRVRPPMTLRAEDAERVASELRDLMVYGDKAPKGEPSIQGTGTLDKALDDVERDALDRFTRDAMLIQRSELRISSYGERYDGPSRQDVSGAYARMSFVQDWLPVKHWEALITFGKHMLCLHEENLPTIVEIGMERAQSKDSRVARGAYTGTMCTIAQGLNEAYLDFETVQKRRRMSFTLRGRDI
jgi:hypothetical protein